LSHSPRILFSQVGEEGFKLGAMTLEPQAFCAAYWRGKSRRFALALYEGFIHFWEPDSPEFQSAPQEWVFCVEGEPGVSDLELLGEALPRHLQLALEKGTVGRRLQLTDTLTVFLRQPEKPARRVESLYKSSLHFHLGEQEQRASFRLVEVDDDELFRRPAFQWIEHLEDVTHRYHGDEFDFADVLYHHKIPYSSRQEPQLRFSRGDAEQMHRLASLIFWLDADWAAHWIGSSSEASVRVFLPFGRPARAVTGISDRMEGAWCAIAFPRPELWDTWLRTFEPKLDEEFHRDEIAEGWRLWCFHVYFDRTTRPAQLSQHEQLEIRLELRDWLREGAALDDARIAQLLA